jgi:hypothetical protein
MRTSPSPHRYVLVVGDASDSIEELDDVTLVQRHDNVVLIETSLWTAAQMRREGKPHVHVYTSEKAARAAFTLFVP